MDSASSADHEMRKVLPEERTGQPAEAIGHLICDQVAEQVAALPVEVATRLRFPRELIFHHEDDES